MDLAAYLDRPMTPPAPETLAAIAAGPLAPDAALSPDDLDRLLDPAPLEHETGWCVTPDRVAYVAVRTPMPQVTGAMIDWWFDWHQFDAVRYQAWYPGAHADVRSLEPDHPGAKAHWGATHLPREDVGLGMTTVRIDFVAPTELGFSTDALDDPRVATIVCGWVGDPKLRMRAGKMCHVYLNAPEGVVLRSRFWIGAALAPYAPKPIAALGAALLNRPLIRRFGVPRGIAPGLAEHCAREYANLATLLPDLYDKYAGEP